MKKLINADEDSLPMDEEWLQTHGGWTVNWEFRSFKDIEGFMDEKKSER